jgi:succinate-semialdehyde dehydrogenase / glutarate-semialdehyde dehydrogenase
VVYRNKRTSSELPETPFGGVKDSTFGYQVGSEGLQVYMTAKFVSHLG